MNIYTIDYTVTGSGKIVCSTYEEFVKASANFNNDTRFVITSSDATTRTINYSINFRVLE